MQLHLLLRTRLRRYQLSYDVGESFDYGSVWSFRYPINNQMETLVMRSRAANRIGMREPRASEDGHVVLPEQSG